MSTTMKKKGILDLQGKVYIGHPKQNNEYLTNTTLKCDAGPYIYQADIQGDSMTSLSVMRSGVSPESLDFSEIRTIKGSPALFIADILVLKKFEQNADLLLASAKKQRKNTNFLSFEAYTDVVLKDPLQSLDFKETMTREEAEKYIKYRDIYDSDTKYSDPMETYWSNILSETFLLFSYAEEQNFTFNLGIKDNLLYGIRCQAVKVPTKEVQEDEA